MLPYKIFQPNIGFIQIHGLFEAIGFLVSIFLLLKYVKWRFPDKKEHVYSISIYVILGSVIGARLAYVLGNFDYYSSQPLQIINVFAGGLSFFGGLVVAVLFAYLYCRKHKLNFIEYANLFAPYIALGHAIGRIGDYLIGEHIGTTTNLPWAVNVAGELRHPLPLYEIIFLLILFFVLIRLRKNERLNKMLFALYLLGYGIFRFLTGFIRVDEAKLYGLSFIQYATIVFIIIAILLIVKQRRKTKAMV